MFAYVENNIVKEVTHNPNIFIPTYAEKFIDCPDDVKAGWTYDGTTWTPPVVAAQVPESVSMRQARLALLGAGLLSTVDAAIAQGSEADKIEWEYATEVRRDAPLVTNMGIALGMTDDQLDDLFRVAVTL